MFHRSRWFCDDAGDTERRGSFEKDDVKNALLIWFNREKTQYVSWKNVHREKKNA